jgi:hypothetical protein
VAESSKITDTPLRNVTKTLRSTTGLCALCGAWWPACSPQIMPPVWLQSPFRAPALRGMDLDHRGRALFALNMRSPPSRTAIGRCSTMASYLCSGTLARPGATVRTAANSSLIQLLRRLTSILETNIIARNDSTVTHRILIATALRWHPCYGAVLPLINKVAAFAP